MDLAPSISRPLKTRRCSLIGTVLQLDLVLDVVDRVQGIHPQYQGLAVIALHEDLEGGGSADAGDDSILVSQAAVVE